MIEFKLAQLEDSSVLSALAHEIWHQHYTPIIGSEQVNYMLSKFQNETAITQQINEGVEYYLVFDQKKAVGYFSLESRKSSLFISKFYLAKRSRGQGIGKQMLKKISQLAKSKNIEQLELTVNKYNNAYQVYLSLGFENIGSVETNIGGGFIMDDYIMLKKLND
jgi:diamine N-acetyltransferase